MAVTTGAGSLALFWTLVRSYGLYDNRGSFSQCSSTRYGFNTNYIRYRASQLVAVEVCLRHVANAELREKIVGAVSALLYRR